MLLKGSFLLAAFKQEEISSNGLPLAEQYLASNLCILPSDVRVSFPTLFNDCLQIEMDTSILNVTKMIKSSGRLGL